jgi:CRISPR system Cascade subunit CasB
MTTLRETIGAWWRAHIGNRDSSAARALAARLNRADAVGVLAEPAVFALARDTGLLHRPEVLVPLVQVLAAVRESRDGPLPRRLGQGDPPALSPLRFERILRAEGDELAMLLRRALPMVDRACDAGALGADLCRWGDATRAAWAFRYHGANPPAAAGPDTPANTAAADEETEA